MKYVFLILFILLIGCSDNAVGEKFQTDNPCTQHIKIVFTNNAVITHEYTSLEYSMLLDDYAFVVMNGKQHIGTYRVQDIQSLFSY